MMIDPFGFGQMDHDGNRLDMDIGTGTRTVDVRRCVLESIVQSRNMRCLTRSTIPMRNLLP